MEGSGGSKFIMDIPLSAKAASVLSIPSLNGSSSSMANSSSQHLRANNSDLATAPTQAGEETEETNEEQLSRDLALCELLTTYKYCTGIQTTCDTSWTRLDSYVLSGTLFSLFLVLANPSLQAALADGSLDLASYSSTVEQELQELESQCIQVYRRKESEISTLRNELVDCDAVLLALQEMLLGFQADLGGLSGEIRSIQDKSRTLAVQYGNRKQAEDGLAQFLSHIVIAPNLARSITSGPVNRVFQEAVREMNDIYQNVHDTQPQPWSANVPPSQTTAGREMQTHVYKLRCVAVTRVRYVGTRKCVCVSQGPSLC